MKSLGIALIVLGAGLAIWGFTYTGSHDLQSAVGEVLGKEATSDEFQFASIAGPAGAAIGVVGLVLFLSAMRKK